MMKRDPSLVAALISAVIAAIVSAGIAFWTSRSTVKLEMDKATVGAQQSTLHQIIQARLKAYPFAYRLISQMFKDAQEKSVDRAYLERLRSAFDAWDSENGYLLGPKSTNTCYEFRQQLLRTIEVARNGTFDITKLLHHAEQRELALRSDLGIYGFELQGPTPSLDTRERQEY